MWYYWFLPNRMSIKKFKYVLHKYPWGKRHTIARAVFLFSVLMIFLLGVFRTTGFLKLIVIPPPQIGELQSISMYFTCLDKNQFIKEWEVPWKRCIIFGVVELQGRGENLQVHHLLSDIWKQTPPRLKMGYLCFKGIVRSNLIIRQFKNIQRGKWLYVFLECSMVWV